MSRPDTCGRRYIRLRVIRGTRVKPLPLLPSRPGGVCSRPLHGARNLTKPIVTKSLFPPDFVCRFHDQRQLRPLFVVSQDVAFFRAGEPALRAETQLIEVDELRGV